MTVVIMLDNVNNKCNVHATSVTSACQGILSQSRQVAWQPSFFCLQLYDPKFQICTKMLGSETNHQHDVHL